tara:strand:+ start:4619 stop:4804 length:186 start_codon:yes stop_codon:yes gene_type:complete
MNSEEFDFSNLDQFCLEVALDNIIDQFGHQAVQDELEKRALKLVTKYFSEKIKTHSTGISG